MKLLLHTCCAPCLTAFLAGLNEENIRPYLFWYNPNIHPYTEYSSRRESLIAFAHGNKLELSADNDYGLRCFIRGLFKRNDPAGLQDNADKSIDEMSAENRCLFCYRIRLERTAQYAVENGFDSFSTTLLASPYQNHDFIRKTGEECAAQYGIDFFYRDYRKRYREGRETARAQGSYMQKYCGCIFSEEERYLGK